MGQIKVEIQKGRIVDSNEIRNMVGRCADGFYILSIEGLDPLTLPKAYQRLYFNRLDICSQHTGYTQSELHELFKVHMNITTTKDLDIVAWRGLIKELKEWAFESFDCFL